jgi:serine/threonine protein kinase
LLSVLHYLRAKNLVHSDINPSNILIDEYRKPRLADFGLCQEGVNPSNKSFTGTLRYSSPETVQGNPPSPQSDIWSLGCTLYEMVCMRPCFENPNPVRISKQISNLEF